MTSRIPPLPEIPLHHRNSKAFVHTPRGGGTPRSISTNSRTSPRNGLQVATAGLSGGSAAAPILLNEKGDPIIISSTSKTRYMLAQPPSPRSAAPPSSSSRLPPVNSARGRAVGTQTAPKPTEDPDELGNMGIGRGAEENSQQEMATQQNQGKIVSPRSQKGGNMVDAVSSSTLTRSDLRGIGNLVTFNSKLKHTHRQQNAASAIPSLAFAVRVKGPSDSALGLQVATIDPQESALDTVLRLTSPEELRIPAFVDVKSNVPFSTRLVTLLKGSTSIPMHWEGEREGVAKDHAHLQALKDAKMRIEAAKRQEIALNEAKARCCLAALYYNTHNMEGAIKALTPAVGLFEGCGHAPALAFVLNALGVAHFHSGEYKMALVYFRKQEALSGDYGKAVARINLGVCYAALEEPHFSQQAFEDALDSAKASDEPVLETIAVGNRGLAFMRLGNMREAQTALEECLEHCSVASDHVGATVVLLLLGQNSAACKDYKQAIFYYEHAMRIAEQAQCGPLLAMAKVSVGVCRGQAGSEGQVMATATHMGKTLSVADVVSALAIKDKDL